MDLLRDWRDVRNADAQPHTRNADQPALLVGVKRTGTIAREASVVIPHGARYPVIG